jgi:hypothetical protein
LPAPASTAIKLILDDHSAHISKETKSWLASTPSGRFEFTFTLIHGSWLKLIGGFFCKFAGSVLRYIRMASKQELRKRIMAGIEDVNRPSCHPHMVRQTNHINRPQRVMDRKFRVVFSYELRLCVMLDFNDQATLDEVAQAVCIRITGDLGSAPGHRRDHSIDLASRQLITKADGVESFISER